MRLRQLLVMYFKPLFVTSSHPDTSSTAIFLRLREPKNTSRLWSDNVLMSDRGWEGRGDGVDEEAETSDETGHFNFAQP